MGRTVILKYDETPAVYVDVDGTLVFWRGCTDPGDPYTGVEGERYPEINQPLVDRLKRFHVPGQTCLVVWSRTGGAHAKRIADLCGLNPDACLPKPRLCIDDKNHSITIFNQRGFDCIDPTFAMDLDKIPIFA
jgi:hypothetical protein